MLGVILDGGVPGPQICQCLETTSHSSTVEGSVMQLGYVRRSVSSLFVDAT